MVMRLTMPHFMVQDEQQRETLLPKHLPAKSHLILRDGTQSRSGQKNLDSRAPCRRQLDKTPRNL